MDFHSAINQQTQRKLWSNVYQYNNIIRSLDNQYLRWTNERYTILFSQIPEYCSQRVPFPSHHRLQISIQYSGITNPKQFESFWIKCSSYGADGQVLKYVSPIIRKRILYFGFENKKKPKTTSQQLFRNCDRAHTTHAALIIIRLYNFFRFFVSI